MTNKKEQQAGENEMKEEQGKEAAMSADSGEAPDPDQADQQEMPDMDTNGTEDATVASASAEEDEDLKTKYLRLAADFQNYKRRTEEEKSAIYAYANEKIAVDLLGVMDSFERAIEHVDESSDKQLGEGMRLVYEQLKSVFERSKIEEIPAEGTLFDPNVHHAVMTEKSETATSETITAVLQKGYTLNGKVIRPSMVKVAE